MNTQYSRIIIIGIIIAAIVPIPSISNSIYNKITSYGIPQTPNIVLHFNGSDSDHYPFNHFAIKQGQNMALVLDVASEPPNIPVTLSTEHHIGFTKTNGLDFQLSPTYVNTPSKVVLYISASKNATPNTYKTTVWTNTLAGGNITLGTGLKIQVINTTTTGQNETSPVSSSCSKIYDKLKFTNDHLDHAKALYTAINDPDFKSLTENKLYNVTDISLNYGLVDNNCNVSDENVQVSFNILNKNGELVQCFSILEDLNLTHVISNAIGCGEHHSQPENFITNNTESISPFVIYSIIIGISSAIATFLYVKIHKK